MMNKFIAFFLSVMMTVCLAGCVVIEIDGEPVGGGKPAEREAFLTVEISGDSEKESDEAESEPAQITEMDAEREEPEAESAVEAPPQEDPQDNEPLESSGTDPPPAGPLIDETGWYYSADEVALYLYTYGELPDNFITKSEARDLGWQGGSVEQYAPGCAIGGDSFGNREGLLPKADGRRYYECDIDTNGKDSRGAKRLVFSNDGLIYYTEDHYENFTLLYEEEGS